MYWKLRTSLGIAILLKLQKFMFIEPTGGADEEGLIFHYLFMEVT
ncbi:hypothetical protein [Bacillus sp. MUM 116]|nr:hypothetical protein [Bacillus sp. MUM 116]